MVVVRRVIAFDKRSKHRHGTAVFQNGSVLSLAFFVKLRPQAFDKRLFGLMRSGEAFLRFRKIILAALFDHVRIAHPDHHIRVI